MDKLDSAILQINKIEKNSEDSQWVNTLHPLVKIIITVIYILTVVSFDKYDFIGLAAMCIYPIVVFITCELGFAECLKRVKFVLPLVCAVGIFNPFFDKSSIMVAEGICVRGGIISMLVLLIKGVYTVFAAYILICSTGIEKICAALRILHIPAIIVTVIMLIYRYINLLIQEAQRLNQAYTLRAPGQKGIHYKVWGTMIGQLLLRSMDRAENVYSSMCLRGYGMADEKGISFEKIRKMTFKDILWLVIWTAVFLLFRKYQVFTLAGNIIMG